MRGAQRWMQDRRSRQYPAAFPPGAQAPSGIQAPAPGAAGYFFGTRVRAASFGVTGAPCCPIRVKGGDGAVLRNR